MLVFVKGWYTASKKIGSKFKAACQTKRYAKLLANADYRVASTTMDNSRIFAYKAWIPNVVGTLSFRKIGETTFPSRSKSANVITDKDGLEIRLIVAYQRRNLSDALFSSVRDYRHRRYMWFVSFFEADRCEKMTNDRLTGAVYIFHSRKSWQNSTEILTKKSFAEQLKSDIDFLNGREYRRNEISDCDLFIGLQRCCASLADLEVQCEIGRDGIVSLCRPRFRSDSTEIASQSYAKNLGHDIHEWIANQAYCFLRDIAHQHQHHHGSADTLLSVQKFDQSQPDDWKFRIVYSLQHFVIDARRRRSLASLIHCKGIMAYRDSFVDISGIKDRPTVTKSEFLLSSIDVQIESSTKSNENVIRGLGFWQSVFAWLAVALAISTLLLQHQIKEIVPGTSGTDFIRSLSSWLESSISWQTAILALSLPIFIYFGVSLYNGLKFDGQEKRIHLTARLIFRDLLIVLNFFSTFRLFGLPLAHAVPISLLSGGIYLLSRGLLGLLSW